MLFSKEVVRFVVIKLAEMNLNYHINHLQKAEDILWMIRNLDGRIAVNESSLANYKALGFTSLVHRYERQLNLRRELRGRLVKYYKKYLLTIINEI